MIDKTTGSLSACPPLLGHGEREITVKCLGVEVDDALVISEQIDL